MGTNYMLLLILCWSIIVVIFAATDSKVKVNPDTGLDPKIPQSLNNTSNLNGKTGGLKPELNSDKVDQVKKGKDQAGGSKEGGEDKKLDEKNPSEQKSVELKGDEKKGEDGSVGKGEKKNPSEQKSVELKGDERKSEDGSVGMGEKKKGDQVEKKDEDGSVGKGENKEGDQVKKKDEDGSVEKGRNKEGDQVEKKDEDGSVEKGGNKEGLSEEGKVDNKEGLSERSDSKEATKEVPEVRKEGSRGEECDVSSSCKAEKYALIACLRVPGNDSPDLSLLIQNKGNDPLSVTISAPNFVQLEKRQVQLRQKEDIKVKVSITEGGTVDQKKKGGTDSMIVLTAGNGYCSLNFRDLTSLDSMKETDYSRKSTYTNFVKKPHFIAFIIFSALLFITASIWMCVSFKRRHFGSSASKYQKLDMELPVSATGKVVSELNDGWDNNWDDDWDDEEAPKTPSMPLTPSLSSKGLASRRLNKEGWKD